MKIFVWRKCQKICLEAIFSHFQSFCREFLLSFYMISLAQKISYCLSANHNPELRCVHVICTGVTCTLFALLLHLNCTALSQSESSNFFMYFNMYQIYFACCIYIFQKEFCVSNYILYIWQLKNL